MIGKLGPPSPLISNGSRPLLSGGLSRSSLNLQLSPTLGSNTALWMPAPKESSNRLPASIVGDSVEKAREVKVNVEQILSALTDLATSHSELKTKFLATRRKSLEKYFIGDDKMRIAAVFSEWKHIKDNIINARRHSVLVDQIYEDGDTNAKLRANLESTCEEKIAEVQKSATKRISEVEILSKASMSEAKGEMQSYRSQVDELQKENQELRLRLHRQQLVLESISQQIGQGSDNIISDNIPLEGGDAYGSCDAPNDMTDYVKGTLHEVLQLIDVKYVPPLTHALFDPSPRTTVLKKQSSHPALRTTMRTSGVFAPRN